MADANGLPLLREDFGVPRVDVQSTTFSVDALGRFICNSWGEATGSGPFDVIVVGSGVYGGYCAEKGFRRRKRVLVLEAGPFLVSEHVQNLARIGLNVPQPVLPESPEAAQARELVWGIVWRGKQIFPGQAYCGGGKSLYWGGWSPRLTDDVLAGWPAAARAYLQGHYERLELQLGVTERRPGQPAPQVGTDFIDDSDPNGLQRCLLDRIRDRRGGGSAHARGAAARAGRRARPGAVLGPL